ncbi:DUF4326 domain-containing protein [Streptomyces sp.]|uniref:DUF4326 domain-containing protein n=1 Tax=Streptomyces sp. TaxID=1931 RepID=UPI002D69A4C7|nr:DUF4326 domain-containing protein [Streptomyces sp.]HZF92039.1 DUF4326 domain-containing protein [Streptomyces sp.]
MTVRQIALDTQPRRIQRRRTKGWRAPAGARYVGRGTRWGNPYLVQQCGPTYAVIDSRTQGVVYGGRHEHEARRVAVDWYGSWAASQSGLAAAARRQLAGRDLMCWCPPDQPCHADVLLELANRTSEQ